MGAMKNWAMVCEELQAARDHWEQCNSSAIAALRAELEAFDRLTRAREEHQRDVQAFIASNGAGSSKDATGTKNGEVYAYCAECGRPVPEDECDGSAPCLHVDCEADYRQGRREAQSDAVADAVMFGQGKGGF